MGGIKNKLNKLSNKTLFKVPLWLKGDVRHKSDRGIVSDTNPLDSQLPSFSQPSEMLTRNISNTRKSNWWSLYASKTISSLRLVTLTKYLSIACLALALISTISLNIIRTYSINDTRTNALDNTTSGIATQSASNGNTLASPASISIKLSPVTTNTTSNPDDGSAIVSLNIPADGGVAVGGHSVEVTTNSTAGYKVTMSLDNGYDSTDLVNTDLPSQTIPSLPEPEPTSDTLTPLEDKTWGVAILVDPFSSIFSSNEVYSSTDQTVLSQAKFIAPGYILRMLDDIGSSEQPTGPNHDGTAADNLGNIYYGVRIDDPSTFATGQYATSITYTATAILPPAPELTKLVINDSVQQNQTSEFAIEGISLDTFSSIKLCPTGQQPDTTNANCYEVPSEDIDTYLDDTTTSTKGTVLSFTNPAISEPGTYDLYAISSTGQTKLGQPFIVQEESICRNGNPNSDCQVDIDDNMIPIAYNEDEDSWQIVTKSEIESTSGSWYDYGEKKWANAITLRNDYEGGGVCANSVEGVVGSTFMGANSCHGSYDTATYTPLEYAMAVYNGDIPNGGATNDLFDVDRISTENNYGGMILGYWVYVPRYAYEVQRPNAIDRVVTDEYPLPDNKRTNNYNSHSIRNEFSIHFEKATDTKKTPAETCNILNPTKEQMWANGTPTVGAGPDNTNILAKDYRTGCAAPGNTNNISRLYTDATTQAGTNTVANNTTWATHPAFTFGSTELNGLWIGKFETTGKVKAPTVKPNQHANVSGDIGEFYTMARSIGTGTYDPTNNGGNDVPGITQNSHNLSTATSHMLKNSEWGAIAYLASSKYGAGTNNVSINSAEPSTSGDADTSRPMSLFRSGITGCGPNNIYRSARTYSSVTTSTGETVDLPALSSSHIEDPLACGDVDHSYIGNIGQLASTTNNVYGIYDMSGGAYEYVMGNLTGYDDQSESDNTSYTGNPIKPPYVDLYKESPYGNFTSGLSGTSNNPVAWSPDAFEEMWNNEVCTWGTCGGHALNETKQYQTVTDSNRSWGVDYSYFVASNPRLGYRWFLRGGYTDAGYRAGLFGSSNDDGASKIDDGFRSVLLAAPQG